MAKGKVLRVLSLEGGGMRGIYTATYLARVQQGFEKRRKVDGTIDLGAAFDLIVGTSTGAIIGCALAAGVPLSEIVELYRKAGPLIFERQVPDGGWFALAKDLHGRSASLEKGAEALREVLVEKFGDTKVIDIFKNRHIGLAITAVEMSQHRSWVFKTPHLSTSNHRDDNYSLVDICMASSAAPIYRSMAVLDPPDDLQDAYRIFVDGGLWANNPVLVALIDALEMSADGDEIHIFCLGTCPYPAGQQIKKEEIHRGLQGWKFGGEAASLSIDAQGFAFHNMARMIARHVNRKIEIIQFPHDNVPAALMPHLALDDTSLESAEALIRQAHTDANFTNSVCSDRQQKDGQLICSLFNEAPLRTE